MKQSRENSELSLTAGDIFEMSKYDITHYHLDLRVDNTNVNIGGHTTIQAKVLQDLNAIVLELHQAMLIDSVNLNGKAVNCNRANTILTVVSTTLLKSGTAFKLTIYYHGTAPYSASGDNGLSSWNKFTSSVSEPYSAYEWFPCKQILSDKADSSSVWITTDSSNKAGSNGILKNKVMLPNGKIRYEWYSAYPIAYYLISIAVGPYREYNIYAHPAGSGPVLIQNYIYKNADASDINTINYTPQLIEYFSSIIGLYPFAKEKYGHCQASINGGMEHQTMTTLSAFRFGLITHELAHQWFGDYVTCQGWSDIWLNEGFASYFEYIALEKFFPSQKAQWIQNAMNNAKISLGTVFVTDSFSTSTLFDDNSTYKKGAILLHMLRYEINNDSLFFLGLRNYLDAKKYSTSMSADFIKTMEKTCGKNFSYFLGQWFYRPGYPQFSGQWSQVQDEFFLQIDQTPSSGFSVFKTTLDVQLLFPAGDTVIRVNIESARTSFNIMLQNKTIIGAKFDPQNNILCDKFNIDYNPILGIKSQPIGPLSVYPNPADAKLNLANANGCHALLFDTSGKILLENDITSDNFTFDIDKLSIGIYYIQLINSSGKATFKFSKQ